MNTEASTKSIKKRIFYTSCVAIFLTFVMIVLGGIVKNTGSSLACPDWPTCNGTLFPEMKGIVAIEHSHRLLGTLIGIIICLLVLLSSKIRKIDSKLHKATIVALVFVIIQGIMGGATVLTQITPLYSTIHLALSHIFFASLLYIYFETCGDSPADSTWPKVPTKLIKLSGIALALTFLQILLGGIIRHYGAGPACGLGWEAAILCQELTTAKLTIWPMNGPGQLHMLHRLNGFFLLFALVGLTIPMLKFARLNKLKSLRRHLIGIHLIVTVQVLLGIKVVGTYIAPLAITLHLAFGLALWSLVAGLFFKLKGKHGK
ncbi:MAG: COX15/CtaA family protein [Bdellovibrionota bacterium]